MKRFWIRGALILFGILLPFFILEVALRIEQLVSKDVPFFTNPRDRWDPSLGWLGKEHTLGPQSRNQILVLGDSFTEGLGIKSSDMWFASLQEIYPESRITAYGGLGYSTLQELLVLKSYQAKGLKPSLIVLQMCSNDLMNNYYPLEKLTYLQRAPGPRPYLENGLIETRFPRSYDWILYPLISFSRFAYRSNTKWETRLAQMAGEKKIETVEYEIQKVGFTFPLFREAVTITNSLIKEFKEQVGAGKLLLMLIDDLEPYSAAITTIAKKQSIPLVIPVRRSPVSEKDRLRDGTHLNETGNRLVGESLVQLGIDRGIFQPP